jgi:cobalt-zinc-cadmium efflux system outer membrane protein
MMASPKDLRIAVVMVGVVLLVARPASADVMPQAAELPSLLTFQDALDIWHRHGLDVLLAEAAVKTSEGGVVMAGAVKNPVATATFSDIFTYQWTKASEFDCNYTGAVCPPWGYAFNLSDSAAIEDALSGKRDLRLKAARNALAAAKMSRVDAARTIGFQVKSAYVQVAQAQLAFRFAKDTALSEATTLKKFQDRYKAGAIGEGDLERIEVAKLEADQAETAAQAALRQARAALAFLLGVRGTMPDFDVDTEVLDYVEPARLRDASPFTLVKSAVDGRPDLLSSSYALASAEAQLRVVRRQKFPDITLGVNYQWGGAGGWSVDNAPVGPQILFSLSAPIPAFYQLQGEERQAEAQHDTAALQQAKNTAQVASDVATAFAAVDASKKLIERMEGWRRTDGGLLKSAKGAFEIVAAQYDKGAASLTEYLDALRTYIATKNEYFGDLTAYWTAVFQLEAAVGRDLR